MFVIIVSYCSWGGRHLKICSVITVINLVGVSKYAVLGTEGAGPEKSPKS